ncbi:hypothetical protein SKM62_04375 [Acinetobacter faecalis]|uniref:Uncharacterized protein n=1 Tax=Acinetobacter faecalis TaxID=2665161 RepID=A0A6L6GCC9_9GAMM|nr:MULTISPECIES: hypothetical protein [Acinetobacter]MDY6488231.1 hypothetical protein [Acinetobacter faecalis]MDY6511355.1 hypothetical protein [Acinetobacter faecalis]MDY6529945.1 hypothetical protein [Acinetobacter faecalis]MDY6536171.1 hypothetical protein [Acinetobacter faecalis]MTD10342.1 hypothetical protein [Acinetobacter faecalis]
MPLSDNQQNIHLLKFLELLEYCYDGKLKAFSDDFSNFDDTFYEKLKKEVQRAKVGTISLKKEDTFKKYNFFLEYKVWEKNNTNMSMKKFDLNIDGLIKSICK